MMLPTKLLMFTMLALLLSGSALYWQIQRNGELKAATDQLAWIVANQARDAQHQGRVLASHQKERARLDGEYETTKIQLREMLRGRPFADCVVPADIRMHLNAGASNADTATGNTHRTNSDTTVSR